MTYLKTPIPARCRASLERRFWAKVRKGDGCWEWTGAAIPRGYGITSVCMEGAQFFLYAHRASYEMHFGPIPDGLFVCHRCDNPPCIRPEHLFLGTPQENTLDAQRKGRIPTKRPPVRLSKEERQARRARGERFSSAKLTESRVRQLRRDYVSGATVYELAEQYGIHFTNAYRIAIGARWKHVPLEGVRDNPRAA